MASLEETFEAPLFLSVKFTILITSAQSSTLVCHSFCTATDVNDSSNAGFTVAYSNELTP